MKLLRSLLSATLLAALVSGCATAQEMPAEEMPAPAEAAPVQTTPQEVSTALNYKMNSLEGKEVDLSKYAGKVVMIVNVASKCGNTKQYAPLQELHKQYSPQGLAILGFPANNFGGQEPGSEAEIGEFCKKNYGVEFDMFSKISVKGDDKAPLYQYLTSPETNPKFPGEITWNFEKFLIGRDGKIAARFAPKVQPNSKEVLDAIQAELAK